jgi:hypothetical protein
VRLLHGDEREELAMTTFADFYEHERTKAIRLAWRHVEVGVLNGRAVGAGIALIAHM